MTRIRIRHLPQPACRLCASIKNTPLGNQKLPLKQRLLLFGFYEALANA